MHDRAPQKSVELGNSTYEGSDVNVVSVWQTMRWRIWRPRRAGSECPALEYVGIQTQLFTKFPVTQHS